MSFEPVTLVSTDGTRFVALDPVMLNDLLAQGYARVVDTSDNDSTSDDDTDTESESRSLRIELPSWMTPKSDNE